MLVLVVCLTGAVAFAPSLPAPGVHALLAAVLAVLVAVAGALAAPRIAPRLRTLRSRIAQRWGVLKMPRRYARQVVLVQAGAWTCRIGRVLACSLPSACAPPCRRRAWSWSWPGCPRWCR